MASEPFPSHWPFDPRRLLTALIRARRAQGLDQTQLAQRLGVTRQQVSYLESGTADLRTSTLMGWARSLGLRLDLVPNDAPLCVVPGFDAHRDPVRVPFEEFSRHALLLGAPGSGHSVALRHLASAFCGLGASLLLLDFTDSESIQTDARSLAGSLNRSFLELHAGDDPLTNASAVADVLASLRRPAPAVAYLSTSPASAHGPALAARSFTELLGFDRPAPNGIAVMVEGAEHAPLEVLSELLRRGRAAGVSVLLSARSISRFPSSAFLELVRNIEVILAMAPGSDADALHDLLSSRVEQSLVPSPGDLAALGVGEMLVASSALTPKLQWCSVPSR